MCDGMSHDLRDAMSTGQQPFQCHVCKGRFTRFENLKRHKAVHSQAHDHAAIKCDLCDATFSRRDLRNRHMKRKHPACEDSIEYAHARRRGPSPTGPARRYRLPRQHEEQEEATIQDELLEDWFAGPSQSGITDGRVSPSQHRTVQYNETLDFILDDISPRTATTRRSSSGMPWLSQSPDPNITNGYEDKWNPSDTQTAHGFSLYFANVAGWVPFLHRPSFDQARINPSLNLSMLCLAYQYGEDPDCDNRPGSGADLSIRCFHQAHALVAQQDEIATDTDQIVQLVQSYCLLEFCAILFLCGEHSILGLRMHSRMISLARSGALTQPEQNDLAVPAHDLESLWQDFIRKETQKRTILAVHQVDALWYQLLSLPRSLSHLELKHALPCQERLWGSCSAAEWAHLQLTKNYPAQPLLYVDAIRTFLSATPDISSLPPFDPFGTISIAHFLLSSAREISGWSTMTGRVSLERYTALRSSLEALEPFTRPSDGASTGTSSAVSCQATWQIAMIELRMWSPSHTSGDVECSIDASLEKTTSLASSCESVFCEDTARDIQPRLDWFLLYLEETREPECRCEPPWIAVYAYKAILIAFQLMQKGFKGAMGVIGVRDGDIQAAIVWTKAAFERRRSRQVGRLILRYLNSLSLYSI